MKKKIDAIIFIIVYLAVLVFCVYAAVKICESGMDDFAVFALGIGTGFTGGLLSFVLVKQMERMHK